MLLLVLAIANWSNNREPALASADRLRITESDFRAAYTRWMLTTGVPDAPQRRVAFIKDLAGTRLLTQNARDSGIEAEPHYQDRLERLSRKLLIDLYVEQTVLDTIKVTDAETRQAYVRAQSQVTARHLYARTLLEAEALYRQLTAGASWDSLSREVFKDPQLQQSGGQLPPFSFDETDPNFEEVAFTLPIGTYSRPVRTAQGYSIIRVDDRFTHPILTESDYVAKHALFAAYIKDRKRSRARQGFVLDLVEKADIVFSEETIEALLARILHGNASESQKLWDKVLLQVSTPPMAWTVQDFREHARFASNRQRAQVRTAADLKEFARGLVAGAIMLKRAQRFERLPEYKTRLQEALDDYIVAHTRRTLEEVAVTEDEIEAYYANAPRLEFTRPARVQLYWRFFPSEAEARATPDTSGYEVAWFDTAQLGAMADEVFGAEEDTLLGPFETPQGWVSLRVGPQRAQQQQSLDEARAAIESMLREQRLRAQRVALYDSLAEHHHLIVHADLVTNLVLDI